jgi:hypothetical protein
MLDALARAGLTHRIVSKENLGNEVVTVYSAASIGLHPGS